MLWGGVPDANETTDYTDGTDVRLGAHAARVLISAALPLQRMRSNGQAFKQSFNHEYTQRASLVLNRASARESFRNYVACAFPRAVNPKTPRKTAESTAQPWQHAPQVRC